MDKTGIIVVSICVLLLGWWFVEQNKIAQEQARYAAAHPVARPTNQVATVTATATANGASTPITTTSALPFNPNLTEQLLVLTNSHVRYTFTSRGGGLKLVELLDYPETVSARWQKQDFKTMNNFASLNTHAAVPVLAVLGDPSFVGDGNFTLSRTADGVGVRAEKQFADGLVLAKEFHPSSNYLVNASVTWFNTSDKTLALPAQEWVVGTATPMDADDNELYLGAMWSDGADYTDTVPAYFNTNTTTLGIFPRTPKAEYRAGANNVLWAAAHNQFFALLAMTRTNEPAQQFVARAVTLPALVAGYSGSPIGIQGALVYPAQTLTANSSATRQIFIFAGPKEFRLLSRIGAEFQNHADLAMNFGTGYMGFWGVGTFFAKLLLSGMNWLHDVTNMGYGWAIVTITILLRAIFWPFTRASMRSAKKMQALAPEIAVLKEKYKDDPQKFTQKQMELWKKNKVNPMSGCLPMLVQMPVFFGFLAMIRCAIELRGAHFLWVADLTKPDTIFMIPGINFPFNLLPLLMVGTMVWQAHVQPASPGMDASHQKMMRFIPLMFLLFFYNYSSGMALYMTVSTLAGILQTRMTKITVAAAPAPTTNPALTPANKNKK